MKLAAKIVLAFLVGSIFLLVIDGVLAVRSEHQHFEQEAEADVRLLGTTMQAVVGEVWRRLGEEEALRLVADVDRQRPLVAIRWAWADEPTTAGDGWQLAPREVAGLQEGREVVVRRSAGSLRFLVAYFPIELPGGRMGALEFAENLAPVEDATRLHMMRIGLLTLGLSMLAVILAAPFGMRVVGRPLQKLVEKTRRIGRNDFSGPIRLTGKDELTELADSLNAMCEQLAESRERLVRETEVRIAALEQVRHEDRLRTVGRLASGVAHELGTPLNVVQGRAGLIAKRRLDEEEIVEAGKIIGVQAKSMTGIVSQLLDFARIEAPEKTNIRPREIAGEVVDLLRPMARMRGAVLRITGEEDVGEVQADAGQIRQVLTNLAMNGLQSLASAGTVDIGLGRQLAEPPAGVGAEPGEYLCLAVLDDGEGISADDLPHLFEPFFTTKDVGEGTGLGLSIVHGIVREHGGWIEVSSKRGEGSRFLVFLPLLESG